MNVLDLYSGIGGFSLGLERAGMKTVAFCEIEPYPQAVLRKNFPGVPIYDDVRTISAERLATDGIGRVDLVCGGFPCQPFSNAGKRRGKDDDRFLWPEMLRIVQEFQPTWVIGENVAGFIDMALCDVSFDLEAAGYEVQSLVIPACAVGLPHRRDRVWIMAHNQEKRPIKGMESVPKGRLPREFGRVDFNSWENWLDSTVVTTEYAGIPPWLGELECYGNTVTPLIPEIIGNIIMEIEGF